MTPIEKQVLINFKNLLSKRINDFELFLYGSRARGDSKPDSDMDVLVIAGQVTKEIEDYVSDCAWEAGFEHNIIVVPLAYTRAEWETSPERSSSFAQAIRREGIAV